MKRKDFTKITTMVATSAVLATSVAAPVNMAMAADADNKYIRDTDYR